MKRNLKLSALIMMGAAACGIANADTLSYWGGDPALQQSNMGPYLMSLDNGLHKFDAYCTDLEVTFSGYNGNSWQVVSTNTNSASYIPSPQTGRQMAYIVNHFGTGLGAGDKDKASGVQLALWKLTTTSVTGLNELQGYINGYVTANTNANNYLTASLAATASDVSPFYISALDGNGRQISQNFIRPVPEPFTMALTLGGLGLAVRRRVRKNAK